MKNTQFAKKWAVSTNYSKIEISLEDTLYSDSMLNLAPAIYIEKYLLDSVATSVDYNRSFTLNNIDFQKTFFQKLMFQNDTIELYKIYWNKDSTDFNDYSSFILYTKQYGIVYKTFRTKGKEFYRYRLRTIMCENHQIISFDDFTNKLLDDTIIFPKAIGLPK